MSASPCSPPPPRSSRRASASARPWRSAVWCSPSPSPRSSSAAPRAPEGALAAGTGFVLWSGLVGASGVALRSSLPAIAEVQDGPSAIFAIMAAAIFGAEGVDDAAKLPTLEAAILATTTASGALMMALGRAKLGNIVRLLPSPVTGGFLAGTGWVLSTGAFKVLTGLAFSVDNVVVAAKSPELFTVVAPGVALGAALAVGNRKIGAFWVVPAFLGGGVAAYFAGLDVALGLTPDDALAAGYLLGPFATDAVSGSFQPLLFSPETLAKVRWDVVLDQGPRAATVFGLSTLGLLLITSAVEVSTEREGDANEELKAVGLANVVSGLGGGLVSYHSLSSTQIAHGMGSSSRLPGVVAAAVYAAALVVGPRRSRTCRGRSSAVYSPSSARRFCTSGSSRVAKTYPDRNSPSCCSSSSPSPVRGTSPASSPACWAPPPSLSAITAACPSFEADFASEAAAASDPPPRGPEPTSTS